jgi:hypothetical protein
MPIRNSLIGISFVDWHLMVNLDPSHYTADACIVWCFDNRFWPAFLGFVKEKNLAHFDPVFIAGGAKSLAAPEKPEDRDFVLRQIEKSIALHKAAKIILMTHSDCGAFGGLIGFGNNKEAEFARHQEVLGEAKKAVAAKFPNLPADAYFFHFGGSIAVQ